MSAEDYVTYIGIISHAYIKIVLRITVLDERVLEM